jgi:hypothetical protein
VNEHIILALTRLHPLACILTILALRKVGTSKVEQSVDLDTVSSNSEAKADVDAEETIKGTPPPIVKVIDEK